MASSWSTAHAPPTSAVWPLSLWECRQMTMEHLTPSWESESESSEACVVCMCG